MLVFNRIFDRDDVPGVSRIDLADERGERRRLSRSRRAAHENQSARRLHEIGKRRRKIQLRNGRYVGRQRTNGRRGRAALSMDVHAESPCASIALRYRATEAEGEVDGAIGEESFGETSRHDIRQQRMDVVVRERFRVRLCEDSVDAKDRRRAGDQ